MVPDIFSGGGAIALMQRVDDLNVGGPGKGEEAVDVCRFQVGGAFAGRSRPEAEVVDAAVLEQRYELGIGAGKKIARHPTMVRPLGSSENADPAKSGGTE